MTELIPRQKYVQQLLSWQDKRVIKVITGVRRAGKSTLLDFLTTQLLKSGVSPDQVIRFDMEEIGLEPLTDIHQLHTAVVSRLRDQRQYYLLIDEVQMIKDWQKAIVSLFRRPNIDIYLTGSNAYLLSGELATLIAGRYVQIEVLPLSFGEFCARPGADRDREGNFQRYISDGGFPFVTTLTDQRNIRDYLQDLYNTIIIRDVVARYQIRDVTALQRVARFLFDNVGNLTSIKKIADTMNSDGQKVSVTSLDNYINGLLEAYIFYRVERFDIKGKQILKSGAKYYTSDLGWRFHLRGSKLDDEGRVLENIVYLELRRRGYDVFVGKYGDQEIDFLATAGQNQVYYQVSNTVRDERTLTRELAPLQQVSDHYQKILLTLDRRPPYNYNGIQQLNVLDWLLR